MIPHEELCKQLDPKGIQWKRRLVILALKKKIQSQ